jgi:hypothetical protein
MGDVLQELFGSIPLSKLLEALESDIDDLLWALEAPLGETAYQRIVSSQRPARELAQTIRSRKNEAPLCDAFRDAVLASTKLFEHLTPAAKARVSPPSYDEHRSHARPPPPTARPRTTGPLLRRLVSPPPTRHAPGLTLIDSLGQSRHHV